jgi:hypothetical protein
LAYELFDGRPFSLSTGRSYRPVAGVYDGVMVALDEIWQHRKSLIISKDEIQYNYMALVKKYSSSGLLTGSANTAADIRNRIEIFRQFFKGFI